jgi:small subunit ribosomal protein S6
MPLYEHVFLARQDISTQQVEGLVQEFRTIIEGQGGTIGKTEYWGLKGLTFRIKKNRKAHFSLLNIDASPAALAEMERQMGINEDIIRFMTVRVEALEQGSSAMMRKRDDDDRGERGDRHDRGDRGRGPRPERGERAPRRPRDETVASEEAGS